MMSKKEKGKKKTLKQSGFILKNATFSAETSSMVIFGKIALNHSQVRLWRFRHVSGCDFGSGARREAMRGSVIVAGFLFFSFLVFFLSFFLYGMLERTLTRNMREMSVWGVGGGHLCLSWLG